MRIALLEDDPDQAVLVKGWLEQAGHRVVHFDSSRQFLRAILQESFDLYILDWVLPEMTGIEVLRHLRQSTQGRDPVLFVTVKDAERYVVEALEAGADDYMAKPVRKLELLARVNALGRRTGSMSTEESFDAPPYVFDTRAQKIELNKDQIELTNREFELAVFLFRNTGRILSRTHILESIWGIRNPNLTTRTVDTHISRLRKKMQIGKQNGWKLSAIYQHGYRLDRMRAD